MDGGVFISYNRRDRAYVDQLARWLTSRGIPVWFDYEIATGERFARVIEQEISTSAAMIVVMTPASMSSEWVDREIAFASTRRKAILPLLLEPCDTPILLANLNVEIVTSGQLPSDRLVDLLATLVGVPAAVGTAMQSEAVIAAVDPAPGASPARQSRSLSIERYRAPEIVRPTKPSAFANTIVALLATLAGLGWAVMAFVVTWLRWFDGVYLAVLVVGAIMLVLFAAWNSQVDAFEGGWAWFVNISVLVLLTFQIVAAVLMRGPAQIYAILSVIVFGGALVVGWVHVGTADNLRAGWSRYAREIEIAEQVRDTRWLGEGSGNRLLDLLGDIPSARFVHLRGRITSTDRFLTDAVVCGNRVVFIDRRSWPGGFYTQTGGASFDLRLDGQPYRVGSEQLSAIRKQLDEWRPKMPLAQVLAILVVTPSFRSDDVIELHARGADTVRLATPETFVDVATEILAPAAYRVEPSTIAAILHAT